jgi:demethylmenaquinone methyltransferase/2-methoxy-6-polyprenyl-1,4-benzoquinol methylase
MNEVEKLKPYSESSEDKKIQIEKMFDNIAVKYDFLNHLLSAGIDILWRKQAIKELKDIAPKRMMDMATGTGDFAFEALALNPEQVVGIDLSQNMLDVGIEKSKNRKVSDKIQFVKGDAEQ